MRSNEQPAILTTNIPSSSKNENILKAASGGSILLVGRILEFAGRFAFGIIVARSIGAAGYGLTVLGVTVATIVATFARMGFSEGIVHFLPAALREKDHMRAWGILQVGLIIPGLISLVLGALLFVSSGMLAENLFHEPTLVPILHWASIGVPLIAIGYISMAATRSFMRMKYQMFAESIVLNFGKLILTILFIYLGLGATGVMAAYSVTWIVVAGLMFYFLNRLFSLKRTLLISRQITRRLFSFSAPVLLTQLVNQFNGSFELLLLGILGTVTSVGIYNGALRIQMVGIMFLGAMEMASKPIISDLFIRGEIEQLRYLYKSLTRWCLTFILPYFLTIMFFATPILAIFGKEFEAGTFALLIVSIGMLVNAGTGICGAIIIMTGHTRLEFFNNVGTVILNTVLNIILIPIWGIAGAAIGVALTDVLINIARLFQIYWLFKLWPYDSSFVKPFLASAVTLSLVFFVIRVIPADTSLFNLILNITLLWIVFAAATILLGLSQDDRMLLSHIGKRLNARLRKA